MAIGLWSQLHQVWSLVPVLIVAATEDSLLHHLHGDKRSLTFCTTRSEHDMLEDSSLRRC